MNHSLLGTKQEGVVRRVRVDDLPPGLLGDQKLPARSALAR